MKETIKKKGSARVLVALLGLFSASFIVGVELLGQYMLTASIEPKLQALRAEYAYSQEFYRRQLNSFEEGMTIVRQVESSARLTRLDGKSARLQLALATWNEWQNDNHLYMSPSLLEKAKGLTMAGIRYVGQAQSGRKPALGSISDSADEVKDRLFLEARDPSVHLAQEE